MISLGDTGDGVRAWQRIVGAHADGTFGPATDIKVRAWQADCGVEADGAIGPLTRARLQPGDLIKPFEGLRLHTYDDHDGTPLSIVAGVWRRPDGTECKGYPTIGWGRRVWPGETLVTCTLEQAESWFAASLKHTYLPPVSAAGITDPAQVAAVACFSYNVGPGAVAELAAAKFSRKQWMKYVRTKGVINAGLQQRRAEEYAIFAGSEDAVSPPDLQAA